MSYPFSATALRIGADKPKEEKLIRLSRWMFFVVSVVFHTECRYRKRVTTLGLSEHDGLEAYRKLLLIAMEWL